MTARNVAGQSVAVTAQLALASRLRSVAPFLAPATGLPPVAADPSVDSAEVFEVVVAAVEKEPTADRIWLLLTALSAEYPTRGAVDTARRRFELDSPIDLRMFLLDGALRDVTSVGTALAEIEVVVGGVVVDVDHSAKHDLHTGIQRVARNLLPVWDADHLLVPAAWTATGTCLRRLTTTESDRVIRWAHRDSAGRPDPETAVPIESSALLVPWRSVVVMVEVPAGAANDRYAALGSVSGNQLVGIAYDAIPIVSADAVPPVESMKFARYLSAVKFATRMAGISAAATAEIGGFVKMLPTQGLVGPVVSEVSLPAASQPAWVAPRTPPPADGVPMVLCVGSHEPRKNHLAVLYAAEVLWREGLQFSLQFIGGSGWGDEFPRMAADMKAVGRLVSVRRSVSDQELDEALGAALFTVFPSLHEGYGLPVAESMAHGTPVITSDFGSMAEIAADGGALTVDPRDDLALTAAMRLLLTDADQLVRLRREIGERPRRGWQDYADQLWGTLVEPALADLAVAPAVPQPVLGI